MGKSLNKILLSIRNQIFTHDNRKKQLEPQLYCKLRNTDSIPATYYGLPEIHKTNVPLRHITSSINCPTHNISKFLARVLSPLQTNKYSVRNSQELAKKITNKTTWKTFSFLSMWYLYIHVDSYRSSAQNCKRNIRTGRLFRNWYVCGKCYESLEICP